jgi:Uma2 family endonuclease
MAVETKSKLTSQEVESHYWPPPQGKWTYEDYTRLPDNGMRYEVIQGELYMSPAPSPKHQRIIAALYGYLWEYLKNQPVGEAFFAPIDVKLPNLATPVQPDLLFIANEQLSIVKEKFIEGVPDLVVEVISPTSATHDRTTKFSIYAMAGVREYWIVDPDARTIEINVLRGQAYAPLGNFGPEDQTRSEVLTDFSVQVGEVCPV